MTSQKRAVRCPKCKSPVSIAGSEQRSRDPRKKLTEPSTSSRSSQPSPSTSRNSSEKKYVPAPQFHRLFGEVAGIQLCVRNLKGVAGVTAAELGARRVTLEALRELQPKVSVELSRATVEADELHRLQRNAQESISALEKKLASEGFAKSIVRFVADIAMDRSSTELQIRQLNEEWRDVRKRIEENQHRSHVLKTLEKALRSAMASPGGKKWSSLPSVTLSKLGEITSRQAESSVASPRDGKSRASRPSSTQARSVFRYKEAPRAKVASCVAALKDLGIDCDPRTFEDDVERFVAVAMANQRGDLQSRAILAQLQGVGNAELESVVFNFLDEPRSRQVRLAEEAISKVIVEHLGPWM